MVDLYFMLSVLFIIKWSGVLLLAAAVLYLVWGKRCLFLKHTWTWKKKPMMWASGGVAGTAHHISCDRCGRANLDYVSWWEPLKHEPTKTRSFGDVIAAARGGPKPPVMQRGFA